MKNDLFKKVTAVINALNNVSVMGESNLANLSGSISILRDVANQISSLPDTPTDTNQ